MSYTTPLSYATKLPSRLVSFASCLSSIINFSPLILCFSSLIPSLDSKGLIFPLILKSIGLRKKVPMTPSMATIKTPVITTFRFIYCLLPKYIFLIHSNSLSKFGTKFLTSSAKLVISPHRFPVSFPPQ